MIFVCFSSLAALLCSCSRCHCRTCDGFSSVVMVTGNPQHPAGRPQKTGSSRAVASSLSLARSHGVGVSRPLQVPMIVKALHKQLKEKSVKTRQCCFNMLTELVNVLPGALTQHIPVLIPGTRCRSTAGSDSVTAARL